MNFTIAGGDVERDEYVGRTEVAFVLGDFIFKDAMIAECIPGQFVHQPMVLVLILTSVSENQIGVDARAEFVKVFLDRLALIGEIPVAKIFHDDFPFSGAAQKQFGATVRLGLASSRDFVRQGVQVHHDLARSRGSLMLTRRTGFRQITGRLHQLAPTTTDILRVTSISGPPYVAVYGLVPVEPGIVDT